jgi:amino acid adenylation domain-containing protein/non-ribosomal peptide synthase protein (TIGR01720 family)
MKNLSDRINALSPAQRALLEKQLQQKGLRKQQTLSPEDSGRIPARGHGRPSPLSYDQERLWLYAQMEPDKSTYNVYFGFRLFGDLQVSALEASLNTILERQHAWRTTFQMQDGKPVQVVQPEQHMELPIHDLTGLPEADRESAAEQLKSELMQQTFDLEKGPILRTALLRLREQEHVFLLVVHHAVTDRVSFSVFFDELTTLYRGHVTGEAIRLPDLPIQYADYAEHQRSWLQGERRETLVQYWKNHLAGSSLQLDLPTDFPRQADKSDRGAREYFQMPLELLEQVKALARGFGMTPNMVFLAAYQALLHRYTHQSDLIVGTPLTNREEAETERIIGYFLTMIPLHVQITPGLTFRELLIQVREVSLGGYAHRQLPFGMLLDELKPERDPSRNPIIQAVFVYVDVAEEPFELPGLQAVPEKMDGGTSIYDLNLGVIESAGGISLIEYNSDLFTAETIQRMIQQYVQILAAVAADPSLPLAQLPLLTPGDQQLLQDEWANSREYASDGLTLAQKFEAQVEKAPDRAALSFAGTSWTYRELNEQANRLARVLRRQGVGAETLVGLCAERSPRLLVGLLAILKAGGAYVPLDPAYPQERLHDLAQDAGLPLVLTERKWQEMLAPLGVPCLLIEEEHAEESADNLPSLATPDSLAYVIYTSGSTGKPKGVLIPQANVLRLFQAAEEHFAFGADDVWTLFHSFSFDFSVWEIWGALLYGGRLVIVPHEVSRTPQDFYELLGREGVTVLNQTPSAFLQLMQAEETAGVSPALALRYVIFGGEALDVQSLQPWFARHGDQQPQLVNMYGITETTVHVTCRPLQAADAASQSGSVIGKPLPDLQLYLLDEQMQPVPIGVRGELYVGGKGLARGYLNRPELTAERFLPHPLRPDSGERVYRTGDVARRLANGDLEYLGRADNQVKIRGFRIELGEVESALRQVEGVQQAAAAVRDDRNGHRRLIGYAVAEKGTTLTSADLRHALQKKVPENLIPSLFVVLEGALPLTANGKIDRAALPMPEQMPAERAHSVAPAETELEQVLVEIWRDVLQVEQVGVHDNFFELGGDSILSISITARASQKGLRLQPRDLFKYQTIRDLARVVKSLPQIHAEQGVVTGEMPLTPIQNWFLARALPEPHHWNLPLLLETGADMDVELLQEAANHLAAHHDALRLCFYREGTGWRQRIQEPAPAAFHQIELSAVPDAELLAALEAEGTAWQAKLDLTEGPLTHFLYFNCGPSRPGRLWLLMHHLIVDTVSWRLLMEDLETVYGQLASGQPVALPAKTTSFKRWTEHLHETATEPRIQRELPHWQAALLPSVRPLPVDFQGDNTEASIRTISLSLGAEETRALLQDVPKAYHTEINDALLTALAQTVSAWTEERSVLVHLEGHGREPMSEEIDLSRTVGFFTAMFPVRLDLNGVTGIGEELKTIKEQLRAIPNKGIGYGLLREFSTSEASHSLRGLPQPEIIFNYLGRFEQGESSTGRFKMSENPMGPICSPNGSRAHVLQVMIGVANGQMEIVWEYSTQLHRRETIEQLVSQYREHLRALIAHCQNPEARGFTPSDFPAARLNQQNLNKLLNQLGKSKGGPKR